MFVTTSVDTSGPAGPQVHISVPYRSLVFRRREGDFVAGMEVAVTATANGDRVGGGFAEARTSVATYAATLADQRLECRVDVLVPAAVDDRELRLRVDVKVRDTSRHWRRELEYSPEDRDVPLYFEDFRWNLAKGPGQDAILGAGVDSLRVRVTVSAPPWSGPWPEGGVTLLGVVSGDRGEPVGSSRQRWLAEPVPAGASSAQELVWSAISLPFGRLALDLRLAVAGPDGPRVRRLQPVRRLVNLAVDFSDDQTWQDQLAWLPDSLSRSQRQTLADLPPASRAAAYHRLWRELADPPDQARRLEIGHLLRIVEADERFGGFDRGAHSDRGRIYVQYGSPDEVQRHEGDPGQDPSWEIWYYLDAGLRFTFIDAFGMGDYRLQERSSL
jgi:GWxTD domain-containing protein